MVRVMVVDDHPMWRDGVVRDSTEAGYEVVAELGEGGQAVRLAPAVRPDWSCWTCSCRTCPGWR